MTQSSESIQNKKSRLPNPKWLPLAGMLLLVWGVALGLWWRQLSASTRTPGTATPVALPSAVVRATPAPGVTPSATPMPAGTPQTQPVVRNAAPSVAQHDWTALARSFDERRALADITELASTRYAGRATGSAGGKLAAEWIAARFAQYGLQPAGDGGTFFQEFPVPYAELTAMPTFAVLDASGQERQSFQFRRDYTILLGGYADGGQVEGRVVWVSNGQHADYDGLNVTGAVVLCRYNARTDEILRQALEHGAKAVLLAQTEPSNYAMRRLAREDALLPRGIPALTVGPDVLRKLLASSGMTLDDLSIEYKSRPLTTHVWFNVPLQYAQQASARNVLGVLPGSDPQASAQVLVLGAHYDHLGTDPDGTLWGGANDDASGVATMLEIARQWQEQGYVPRRTVLFAAWDGEENGLWGSQYYVEHARYPITSTVGMLQLDMVGAGTDILFLDAGGTVAEQSLLAARQLGVPVQAQSMGRSDHAPFVAANVPASMYIWWDGQTPSVIYHVPQDNAAYVQPAKLKAAGELADLVLLDLSWEQPELSQRGTQLQQSVTTGNADRFAQLLDPRDASLRTQQQAWLTAWSVAPRSVVTLTAEVPLVAGDAATSTLSLRYRVDSQEQSTRFPARWVRHSGEWYYAGPAWETVSTAHVHVQHLQQATQAEILATQASALYQRLAHDTNLALPDTLSLHLYPGDALRQALESAPATSPGDTWLQDATLVLTRTSALTTTVLEAALQATGWSTRTASWLAYGLEEVWSASSPTATQELEARYLPALQPVDGSPTLWAPESMPAHDEVASSHLPIWEAQAWAMARYLWDVGGKATLDQATLSALTPWRSAWLEPLQTASAGISATLAARQQAILAGDPATFLASVDAQNLTLYQEETHWFADLQAHPVQEFSYTSRLLALQNDQARVQLTLHYRLAETSATPASVTYVVRFVQRAGRWLYADVDWSATRSEHFVLYTMNATQAASAPSVLEQAERAYVQIMRDLRVLPSTIIAREWASSSLTAALSSTIYFQPPAPIELKWYETTAQFQTSIYLSMIPAHGWTEPGESIKLVNTDPASMGRLIVHELTHQALFVRGVKHGGVHEGVAQYEAGLFDPQWQAQQMRKWRQQVYDLVRSQRNISLASFDDWRTLSEEDRSLIYSVGWDVVTYFCQRFGRYPLWNWLDALGSGQTFDQAMRCVTGDTFTRLDADWREAVLRGHIDAASIATAMTLSGTQALQHVQELAQPTWGGREAGQAGNQAAVQYVAERFAEYGLQPAGDHASYLQEFELTQTMLITTPRLTLWSDDGQTRDLVYRQDFSEMLGDAAGAAGNAEAQIVYVPQGQLAGIQLSGRVLLTEASTDTLSLAVLAQEHGASAVLAVASRDASMALKSDKQPALDARTIPLLQISRDSFEALLDMAGIKLQALKDAPPALPLPLRARIDVQVIVSPTMHAANVLGLLPGSDPELSKQVLIVGAHLDHVGQLPDGSIYPGANDDASGIAVLLEIARTWQARGYRPQRSVLFAAWNAEEEGLLGSQYYTAHPTLALTATHAVLQLDMVGQGRGYYLNAVADELQDALILAHLDNAARQVEGRVNYVQYEAGSDQDSFHQRGIPAIALTWERAENLHQPSDTPDTIDMLKLQATGRVTALTLMTLADEP